MADFATVADVEIDWRDIDPSEVEAVETSLARASALIRRRVPGIDARIQAGALDPILAAAVCASMVIRAMEAKVAAVINPDGVQQVSTTTGPFTESRTFSSGTTRGSALAISPDELAILRPATPRRTIRTPMGLA